MAASEARTAYRPSQPVQNQWPQEEQYWTGRASRQTWHLPSEGPDAKESPLFGEQLDPLHLPEIREETSDEDPGRSEGGREAESPKLMSLVDQRQDDVDSGHESCEPSGDRDAEPCLANGLAALHGPFPN